VRAILLYPLNSDSIIYLDTLGKWLIPQLQEDIPDIPTTLHELKTRIREACANNDQECEISSSHGGEYDVQNCLLGCTAV
jgi:hypothetical protein